MILSIKEYLCRAKQTVLKTTDFQLHENQNKDYSNIDSVVFSSTVIGVIYFKNRLAGCCLIFSFILFSFQINIFWNINMLSNNLLSSAYFVIGHGKVHWAWYEPVRLCCVERWPTMGCLCTAEPLL